MRRLPFAAACAVLLVLDALHATPAHAAPPDSSEAPASPGDRQAQAGSHFAHGVKLYQEEDFRAALIEFTRAYELAPNWAVLYNVGQASYQLREYVVALNTLEKYVREGDAKIPADRRAQVDREIDELRGRVAHVAVVSNVDADVALDDAALGRAFSKESWLVGAGRHKLTASKPGYQPATQVIDVAGGDTVTVRFELAPEVPEPPPVAVSVPPPVVRESPNYAWTAATGVVGLAGVAVGATFGVLTISNKASLDSECSVSKVCPLSAQGDIDAYTRNGTISGVGFGVGAVGLIFSVYLFLHERSRETRTTDALLSPWVGPGAYGVAATF